MWNILARVPRFVVTLLVLFWIIALEVSSNAFWIVSLSFLLTAVISVLSSALVQAQPLSRKKKLKKAYAPFLESEFYLLLPVVWQAVVVGLVFFLYARIVYSDLPIWLLLLSVPPLPVAALQYHYIERNSARRKPKERSG
jgi:hypothetical protein